MARLNTIGHSAGPFEELREAFDAHAIRTLVDIRAFPMSRRLPHFNHGSLEKSLPAAGITYVWMKSLGGYRKQMVDHSTHMGLRNPSFRNYADHMLTPEFENAMAELRSMAEQSPTAYMGSERVYFLCHRMLVSDWLVAHGHEVRHIDGRERHGLISSLPKAASWTDG